MRLVEAGHAVELSPDLLPATLARDGVVLIQGASVAEVRALLDRWTVPVEHPHQVAEGLTVIAPRYRAGDGDNARFRTELTEFKGQQLQLLGLLAAVVAFIATASNIASQS